MKFIHQVLNFHLILVKHKQTHISIQVNIHFQISPLNKSRMNALFSNTVIKDQAKVLDLYFQGQKSRNYFHSKCHFHCQNIKSVLQSNQDLLLFSFQTKVESFSKILYIQAKELISVNVSKILMYSQVSFHLSPLIFKSQRKCKHIQHNPIL